MNGYISKQDLTNKKFHENDLHGFGENTAYRQGWNDAIDAILDNEPPADVIPVDYISGYQQKLRKLLKGRYFPDEAIGWLLKDWRLDLERSNK